MQCIFAAFSIFSPSTWVEGLKTFGNWIREWFAELILPIVQELPSLEAVNWSWLTPHLSLVNAWIPLSYGVTLVGFFIIWRLAWPGLRILLKVIWSG